MAQTPMAFDKHINDWSNSSKVNKALYKGGNIYKVATLVLQLSFILIAFIVMFTSISGGISNLNQMMDKIKSTLGTVKTLIIVSSVIGILAAFWNILDIFTTFVFGRWIHKNNVNVMPELKDFVDVKLSRKAKTRFRKVATAASIDKNKTVVLLNAVSSILRMASSIVIAIAMITYVGNTVLNNLIKVLEVTNGSSLSAINFKAVIDGYQTFLVMVAVSVALSIAASIVNMVWKTHCFGWIRSEVTKDYNEQVEAESAASGENE